MYVFFIFQATEKGAILSQITLVGWGKKRLLCCFWREGEVILRHDILREFRTTDWNEYTLRKI